VSVCLSALLTRIVSEMTYNVSMGTLNPTIPYHTIPSDACLELTRQAQNWQDEFIRSKAKVTRPINMHLSEEGVKGYSKSDSENEAPLVA